MIQLLAGGKAIAFLGGTVVGAIALPVLKSKAVHKAAVSTLATGLSMKSQAEATWGVLQESMNDLYEEAKEKKEEKDLKDLANAINFDFDSEFDFDSTFDWGTDSGEDPFAEDQDDLT